MNTEERNELIAVLRQFVIRVATNIEYASPEEIEVMPMVAELLLSVDESDRRLNH